MWSKKFIPIIFDIVFIWLVKSTSGLLGNGSPLGWLCIIIIDAAFNKNASLNMSLGCTVVTFSVPLNSNL